MLRAAGIAFARPNIQVFHRIFPLSIWRSASERMRCAICFDLYHNFLQDLVFLRDQ